MPRKRKYTRRVTNETTPSENVKPAANGNGKSHYSIGLQAEPMGHNLVFQVGLHKQARLIFNTNYTIDDVRRLSWSLQGFLSAIDEEEKSKIMNVTRTAKSVPVPAQPEVAPMDEVLS